PRRVAARTSGGCTRRLVRRSDGAHTGSHLSRGRGDCGIPRARVLMSATCEAERTVTIVNKHGLHARPAAEFVKLAGKFRADIFVRKDDLEVNGKSIMGMMMLAAECGTAITIRASGVDATAAVDSLAEIG